jgi:hypothetical protein
MSDQPSKPHTWYAVSLAHALSVLESVLVDYWLAITHYNYEPETVGESIASHLVERRKLGRSLVREKLALSATGTNRPVAFPAVDLPVDQLV